MHRYQPRLHIVESQDCNNLNWENFHTFIFPGTQFTTVTAYQNDKVDDTKCGWEVYMEKGALLAMRETCMCAEVTVFRPNPHNDLASSGSVLSVTSPAGSISQQTRKIQADVVAIT